MHGQLYADMGNLNRHSRAPTQELTSLLCPANAKEAVAKDQIGHWYFAQLKHYGLSPTKHMNAAKVRLLNALNSKVLNIPPNVKKLEVALKKEHDAANRKAKAVLRSTPAMSDTTQNKKRKRDEASSATGTVPSSRKTAAPKPSTAPTSSHHAAILPQQTEASQQGPRPLQTARPTKAGLAKIRKTKQGKKAINHQSRGRLVRTKSKVKTEKASKLEKIADEGAKNGRAKKEPKVKVG
ncbi:hypothetical protein LTS18_003745 [Coniosporium uncinatum]|uniref:Uncharacterized protein n=1 Tax=Coniosporium uncinatum TaxID=93489 RepID=A0ACC3DBS1_9PEZI|nr:hypothetical protein LTS18_003745 [Coniosporium uncinatum]